MEAHLDDDSSLMSHQYCFNPVFAVLVSFWRAQV